MSCSVCNEKSPSMRNYCWWGGEYMTCSDACDITVPEYLAEHAAQCFICGNYDMESMREWTMKIKETTAARTIIRHVLICSFACQEKFIGKMGGSGGIKPVCLHCGKASADIKRCSRCHQVYFCNRDCQKAAWPEHKSRCNETK
jgi:hypothetical protein